MSAEVLLGVAGGVASYKSAALCSKLVQTGYGVTVICTESAKSFVGAATFEALSGRKVCSRIFDASFPLGPHIELARKADLMVIAPATANIIGRIANGIADDLLSTTVLSFTGRRLFAPSMNVEMWNKPAVARNVSQMVEDGWDLVRPDAGWQSCRESGTGRMSDPEEIFARIQDVLSP